MVHIHHTKLALIDLLSANSNIEGELQTTFPLGYLLSAYTHAIVSTSRNSAQESSSDPASPSPSSSPEAESSPIANPTQAVVNEDAAPPESVNSPGIETPEYLPQNQIR